MSIRAIYIPILYNSHLDPIKLRVVCCGLEEEGVPFLLQGREDQKNYIELGADAAAMSPLQVGIGIDQEGKVCVHHEKLKQETPYLEDTLQNARSMGQNAARLVKGLPLSL
ncbi:glycerol dehydratase reactivase beta/small subunit family protein [Fictibacillus terranigra]|uniref:Glycerol dehydratase reactivase beta/small subunit family protein n=1 Tax=Fictibacillus terranigra TaxID=3058424 RepID=A0ABT8E522_9BACL|nr:glycerol dehydratase reactivase beta/small subunit family protein [Fictibacillus sp. CENA-BCM004]MDN4073008.1 glycerol dehydratase reactivase beta/small subunit family protein [Fictibacillus sp. CENA-BCM004]